MNSPTLANVLALRPSTNSDDEIETNIRSEGSIPLQLISVPELLQTQDADLFCQQLAADIEQGRTSLFEKDATTQLIVRTRNNRPQVVIPCDLHARLLTLSHLSPLSGHPGGKRMYLQLRQQFYWSSMAADCYTVSQNCIPCAPERVKLRKASTRMKLFPRRTTRGRCSRSL
eukprot:IDg1945t1